MVGNNELYMLATSALTSSTLLLLVLLLDLSLVLNFTWKLLEIRQVSWLTRRWILVIIEHILDRYWVLWCSWVDTCRLWCTILRRTWDNIQWRFVKVIATYARRDGTHVNVGLSRRDGPYYVLLSLWAFWRVKVEFLIT